MNKKIAIIILIILLIVGSIIFGTLSFIRTKDKDENKDKVINQNLINSANYYGADKKVILDNGMIEMSTESGKVIINNIFSPDNTEYNEIGDPVKKVLFTNDLYNIFYIYDGDYFEINLLQEPLITARQQMERKFIELLGVQDKNDVCKLKTYVYIPYSASEELGADKQIDYGFTWCPGSFIFKQK